MKNLSSFIIGLVVGGLTGAALALLLAPETGEETRTMIRERGSELMHRARGEVENRYSTSDLEDDTSSVEIPAYTLPGDKGKGDIP